MQGSYDKLGLTATIYTTVITVLFHPGCTKNTCSKGFATHLFSVWQTKLQIS